MIVKKGELLDIIHERKGRFKGIAIKDFDTKKDEFYSVALAEEEVEGLSTEWVKGEEVPCRKGLCKVRVVEK